MKLLTLHPYGEMRKEGGLLYLITRYLSAFGVEPLQLQCHGGFAQCDRDAQNHFRRKPLQCFQCIAEQSRFAQWASAPQVNISKYLLPDEVRETKRWIEPMEAQQLWSAVWKGVPLRTLLQGSFSKRFGTLEPDFRNKQHEQYVRRLSLAALRMLTASQRCNKDLRPDMVFLTGGDEFITASYFAAVQKTETTLVRFFAGTEARTIKLHKQGQDKPYVTELFVEDISAFRNDVLTWPQELRETLDEIVAYLGLADLQLELPLAQ